MRGVAALLVVLYHLTTNAREKFGADFLGGFFIFGSAGVDFFFVLSGFIIFYVHHLDIGRPDRLSAYIAKRLVRIYPIYWCVTLAVLPAYFLFPHFGNGYERNADVIVKSLLLLPQSHNPIVTVAWTLVHEMLFYVLFGAAIVIGRSAAFLAIAWAIACALIGDSYLFSLYNLEFLGGVLLAYIVVSRKIHFDIPMPRFAVLLGDASYSIYLIHSIVIAAMVKVFWFWAMPIIGLAAVLAGIGMHLLIEKPLMRAIHSSHALARPTIRT